MQLAIMAEKFPSNYWGGVIYLLVVKQMCFDLDENANKGAQILAFGHAIAEKYSYRSSHAFARVVTANTAGSWGGSHF